VPGVESNVMLETFRPKKKGTTTEPPTNRRPGCDSRRTRPCASRARESQAATKRRKLRRGRARRRDELDEGGVSWCVVVCHGVSWCA
jgi:hypothetical protein